MGERKLNKRIFIENIYFIIIYFIVGVLATVNFYTFSNMINK